MEGEMKRKGGETRQGEERGRAWNTWERRCRRGVQEKKEDVHGERSWHVREDVNGRGGIGGGRQCGQGEKGREKDSSRKNPRK